MIGASERARISRSGLLGGIALAAALALQPPTALAQSGGQVVVGTGGGKLEEAYRKVLFAPFTEKTGAEVVTTTNEGARLKAMVEQGNTEWDLIQGPAEALVVFGREGLLEPIDYSCIDRENIVPEAMHEHFVMTDLAAYNVAWNTENVTADPPENWQELWAHDGRISLWQQPYQTLEAALIADGVPLDQLYPLDVDRAFASLDKVKDKLVWWNSGAESAQLILDGEVDAGATWNGRVHLPKVDGAPVDYSFGQAVLVSDGWGVPKGAPNKELANEMICMIMSPQVQADFAAAIPYGPTNRAALELIPEEVTKNLPAADETNVILDVNYWADHGPEVVERFNSWLLQ